MSLKAKLEAVIYAAEEPVTLAQLAALFAAEALEHKAAQSALPGEEQSLLDGVEAVPSEPLAEALPLVAPEAVEDLETAIDQAVEAGASEETESAAEAEADVESGAKREARARDREVKAVLKGILAELIADYEADDRGIEIREIAGGYRMATKPSSHDAVRLFVKSLKPPMKLSLPALETLAVIAYKQPVTAPEVSEIRGVETGGVLGSLLARKLIATAGRKQVIGRPILYKTTKEFLLRFGLKDLSELPSMEEFEKIAAVEIDEMEPAETAASENASNLEETGREESVEAEPSQQAEIEAASDAPKESSSEEVRAHEDGGEEGGREEDGEESSGEKVSHFEAKESR